MSAEPRIATQEVALEWVLGKLAAAKKIPPLTNKLTPPKPISFDTSVIKITRPGPRDPLDPLVIGAQGKLPKTTKAPDRKKELDLYHHWNNNGRTPEHLEPLLKSFQPLIQNRINLYKNRVEVPNAVIEMEHKRAFVKALETFKPDGGSQLHSWVTQQLKQVGRYVGNRQNFARITENISRHIGSFNSVRSELTEKLGYEPSANEIHDYIIEVNHPDLTKLSLRDITRLNKEQRKNTIDKGHDNIGGTSNFGTREEEVIHLIVPQLTDAERRVHELVFGLNGNKKHTPGEIAKKLNFDISKVSKLRTSIYNKMKPHLEEGE